MRDIILSYLAAFWGLLTAIAPYILRESSSPAR